MDKKKKKNLLIGGLISIVLVMAVGYAAFATNLNITSSAQTTSTWDIEITSVVPDNTATCTDRSDASTCTTVGDITHSITNDHLTANFDSALISPGDSVVYTITVQNKGTLDATLNTITRTNSNNEAISFNIAGIAEGDTLAASQSTTFTATVTYVNQGGGQGQPASTSASFGVTLNYTQYAAAPAPEPTGLTTVYAYNTDFKVIGTDTILDGVSDYTQLSSYQNGKTWFLKYDIDNNNVIQKAYVCQTFGELSTPLCLQGGSVDYIADNISALQDFENNSEFSSAGGQCNIYIEGDCYIGNLHMNVYSDTRAVVSAGDYTNTPITCEIAVEGDIRFTVCGS